MLPSFVRPLLSCLVWGLVAVGASFASDEIDFNRDIKPILSNTCFKCHGPDKEERKGGTDGLRLDTPEGATADLGGYAAIVPGSLEKSAMIQRITSTDPEERMPPPSSGRKLAERDIERIKQWVQAGGKYSKHWSYVKPQRPPLPAIKNTAWPRNDIDVFLLARLEREGVAPSPEADRYTLIRRLSLDLTGLPPTLEEVDTFVNDPDPQAYEKLVDRLLKKESYGEHWAHMWLDLARYADSAGYADDPARTIWLFRDYVIRSLNQNKPFDQFTIEQIAGDLLPNPTEDQLVATAFHRNTLTNNEGGTNDEEFRNVAVVDRVNTTMAVWMGTTIACAQCHNHKYDPISQEEYFRFFAIFNNSEDADRTDESPLHSLFTDEQQRQRSQLQDELSRLKQQLEQPSAEVVAAQAQWEQAFPRQLSWRSLRPSVVQSQAGSAMKIADEGDVQVAGGPANDSYTIDLPLEAGTLRGLRLDALPDDALPGKGPGHAAGNFVITRVSGILVPAEERPLTGRFVRIEIPGKQKILSLAEVQVFSGSDNLAPRGEASQSSVDYEGDAKRAIDGNTDGRYVEARSTTHTKISDDPWWELDLKSQQPIERIAIWNRTDAGTEERLKDYRIVILNDQRQAVWEKVEGTAPKPSTELSVTGQRGIVFQTALADYSQSGFEPENVLNNKDPKQKGWAIGGQPGQAHWLTLIPAAPVEVPAGARLRISIEHGSSFAQHTLGHFRLSATDHDGVSEWAKTPPAIITALGIAAEQRTPDQKASIARHFASIAPQLEPARKRMMELEKQFADIKPTTVPIMRELVGDKRRVTKIQHRGNFLDVGQEVSPGVPAEFQPLPPGAAPDRLSLARWLIDENNPLTARVIVNRYWEQIFGIGIVSTSEEFGAQGEQPFHPELLDWLATELVRLRWDMKAMLKLLVMSAAYQQSSRVTPEMAQRDPDNRLLARGPRFRLSAEMVRDQALAVSGLLSRKMLGPPVKPLQPSLGISAAFGSGIDWKTSDGEDRYRRGLYTTWRRSSPYPSMATFDAPNREVCTLRRVRTNTPLQALVTLNDPVYLEAAQALARRMLADGGSNPQDRAQFGFRLCLARPAQDNELKRLLAFYAQALEEFRAKPEIAAKMATDPLGPAPQGADVVELAAWTVVGNVLLNLDETLMKR